MDERDPQYPAFGELMRAHPVAFAVCIAALVAACAPAVVDHHKNVQNAPNGQQLLRSPTVDVACVGGTGSAFVGSKVRLLLTTGANGVPLGFDFPNNGFQIVPGMQPTYYPPNVDPVTSVPEAIQNNLAAAFNLAPIYLKKVLCNEINYILIDPRTDYGSQLFLGWAYWEEESQDQGNGAGRFIALSQNLWKTTPGFGVAELEEQFASRLLPNGVVTGVTAEPPDPRPTSGPTTRALLLILAREAGFVLERNLDAGVLGYHCSPKPTFSEYSWSSNPPTKPAYLGQIRYFGHEQTFAHHLNPLLATSQDINRDIQDINRDILQRRSPQLHEHIERIYGVLSVMPNPEFVDLIAAWGPDQDFISLFGKSMLTELTPPVTQLRVTFNDGKSADEIANLKKPALSAKQVCLRNIETAIP